MMEKPSPSSTGGESHPRLKWPSGVKPRFFCNFTAQTLWGIRPNKNHDFFESIMNQPTNSSILDSNPPQNGFIVDGGIYAAVPYCNRLMIIHNGKQLKVCTTEESARKFIQKHRRGKSVAKLPID